MASPLNPSLYQINTRILLGELGARLGFRATLDDVPDSLLDWIAGAGFDWVWFLGVWQTGELSRQVSRSNAGWRAEFEATLPDLRDEDITGSPFAIRSYTVHADFGGNTALKTLRRRLADRGLKPWVAALSASTGAVPMRRALTTTPPSVDTSRAFAYSRP